MESRCEVQSHKKNHASFITRCGRIWWINSIDSIFGQRIWAASTSCSYSFFTFWPRNGCERPRRRLFNPKKAYFHKNGYWRQLNLNNAIFLNFSSHDLKIDRLFILSSLLNKKKLRKPFFIKKLCLHWWRVDHQIDCGTSSNMHDNFHWNCLKFANSESWIDAF